MDGFANFLADELPFLVKWYDRYVIAPLQRPSKDLLKWIIAGVLGVGVVATFSPLILVNFVNSHHWIKVTPILSKIGFVRIVVDWLYSFMITKLKLLYLLFRFMWTVMLLPLTILNMAFGSLNRIRVIILLSVTPALALKYSNKGLTWLDKVISSSTGFRIMGAKSLSKNMGAVSIVVYALLVVITILTYYKLPLTYTFCYDILTLRTVVMMLFVIAVYVQMSLIVYEDNIKAGRLMGRTKVTPKDMAAKQIELTVVVTSAAVCGVFLLMGLNPGAFAREHLLSHRMVAIE
jgi:hypothetical protein